MLVAQPPTEIALARGHRHLDITVDGVLGVLGHSASSLLSAIVFRDGKSYSWLWGALRDGCHEPSRLTASRPCGFPSSPLRLCLRAPLADWIRYHTTVADELVALDLETLDDGRWPYAIGIARGIPW